MTGSPGNTITPDSIPDGTLVAFIQVWNHGQNLSTPDHHARMAQWLETCWHDNNQELLLMAFRNAGKSTLIGLFAAWLLNGDPARRIMVLSADHSLAKRMVRNVKRIIERHPWTVWLKPRQADEWASDRFTVDRNAELRDPSVVARGIGANITGSRADIVICDDVEVPNTCDTAGKREDLRERLDEIEFVLVPGGTRLYVGTPHTRDSIYMNDTSLPGGTPYLSGYTRFELPLLDTQGASAWPERFPADRIEAMRKRSGPARFQSQMMLRPMSVADSRLHAERLIPYDGDLDYREAGGEAELRIGPKRLVSVSCWWDPAYGSPDHGDASVVACVFTDEDGNLRIHGIEYLTCDPAIVNQISEASQQCRQVIDFATRFYIPAVTIEKNGIGRFLPGLLRQEVAQAQASLAVCDHTSNRPKDLRIIDAFDAPMAAGKLYAHSTVLASPLMAEFHAWRTGAKTRDDGLDAVAGCLMNEPVRLPRRPYDAQQVRPPGWRAGVRHFAVKTDFSI